MTLKEFLWAALFAVCMAGAMDICYRIGLPVPNYPEQPGNER